MATGKNAIILAAGTSSRFVPLSHEVPKGLLRVRGEVLIERQIKLLRDAGIHDITLVIGYKSDLFKYLASKYHVEIVLNEDFDRYNNTSSLIRVLDRLGDTYICSSDNYFLDNVFKEEADQSYYSALYADGKTDEYCITFNDNDVITGVTIGGRDSWYMIGHAYLSADFSTAFKELLKKEYESENVRKGYWEDVFIKHIKDLPPMRINRYREGMIQEFDSIDELRLFDSNYINHTGSSVLQQIARQLNCKEGMLNTFVNIPNPKGTLCFRFKKGSDSFIYMGDTDSIEKI